MIFQRKNTLSRKKNRSSTFDLLPFICYFSFQLSHMIGTHKAFSLFTLRKHLLYNLTIKIHPHVPGAFLSRNARILKKYEKSEKCAVCANLQTCSPRYSAPRAAKFTSLEPENSLFHQLSNGSKLDIRFSRGADYGPQLLSQIS